MEIVYKSFRYQGLEYTVNLSKDYSRQVTKENHVMVRVSIVNNKYDELFRNYYEVTDTSTKFIEALDFALVDFKKEIDAFKAEKKALNDINVVENEDGDLVIY